MILSNPKFAEHGGTVCCNVASGDYNSKIRQDLAVKEYFSDSKAVTIGSINV